VPTPGPGQVRLRVAASAFNAADAGIRSGNLREAFPITLPHTPGYDVAGTVDAVGDGVTSPRIGDAVVGLISMVSNGGAAEFVIADANILTAAPQTIPLPDAAALPSVALTAWQTLFEHAKLTAGQRVLINGAEGAVGGYAVQLAKSAGAHVIATAAPRSAERVRGMGADEVVDYTATAASSGLTESVDVVLNLAPVDPAELSALLSRVRNGGVLVNTTVWMQAPSDEARSVRGVNFYVRGDADQLAELVAMVDRGELRVDIADRVSLADLSAVHAKAAAGELTGKVIILPPEG
jgi:NADPH:quinone reductase-like Zn-dependent oxidoreductase